MGIRAGFLPLVFALWALPCAGEPQSRSRISRLRADMHTVEAALAFYRIDTGTWPPPVAGAQQLDMRLLTTPVAYLKTAIDDHFALYEIRKRPFWRNGALWALVASMVVGAIVYRAIQKRISNRFSPYVESEREPPILEWAIGAVIGMCVLCLGTPFDSSMDSYMIVANEDWTSRERSFHFTTTANGTGILQSLGPDGDLDMTAADFDSASPARAFAPYEYDPTNGTASSGDIIRILEPPGTPIP